MHSRLGLDSLQGAVFRHRCSLRENCCHKGADAFRKQDGIPFFPLLTEPSG
jgi:hypothetical protein